MLTYFLQVNLCWGLFYGLYYALLSRETFFKLNRIYLIISLLCGLVIPLSSAYFSVKDNSPAVIMLEPFVVSANLLREQLAQAETWSVWGILKVLYGIGGAVLGFHFIVGLVRIWAIYRKGEKTNLSEFTLVITVDEGNPDKGGKGVFNPFSFFRWVFFNNNAIQKDDFQQIILHEKAHVTQKHSYDVVFLELLKIAFWWSPLIYFYKKSLVNVHEYLADEAVLQTTTPPQYGRLLLRQMQSGVQPAFANNFFSQFKKRILMMTRNPSQRTALLRYTIAIPMFLLLVSFFSMPNNPVMAKTEDLSAKVETSIHVLDESIKANLNEKPLKIVENKASTSPVVNTIYDDQPLTFELDGGYKGGVLTSEEFKKQKAVVAFEVVKGKRVYWKVASFVGLSIPRFDDITQVNCKGGEFSDYIYTQLSRIKNNDSYQFQNIKAIDEKNNMVVLGSMSFVIRDNVSDKPIERKDTIILPMKKIKEVNLDDVEKIDIKKSTELSKITMTKKDGTVIKFEGTEEDVKNFVKLNSSEPTYDVPPAVKNYGPTTSALPKEGSNRSVKIMIAPSKEGPVHTIVDEQPVFYGGFKAMFEYLGKVTRYPQAARDAKAEGTVYIGFIIETDGSISNVETKRGVTFIQRDTITMIELSDGTKGNKIVETKNEALNKESMRVIESMPKWIPGRKNGKVVRTAFTLPIKFRLE